MSTCLSRRDALLGTALLGSFAGPARASAANSEPPRKFHFGLVTYNLAATWDLPTILRIGKATGVAAVELRTTHGHGVEPALSATERAAIKARFADSPVKLWGLGSVCEFHSPDPAVVRKNIETCRQFLDLTAALGGVGVKVRPNGLPKDVPESRTLEQIGVALRECGQAAADLGLEVWVEVHGSGTAHPPRMKTIMEACGHPAVGITWNSNATDLIDGSIALGFEMLQPWIKSCHINDLYGPYPYRELFARLRTLGYDRYTLMEIGQKLDPANGELLLRYYKALWHELSKPSTV